MADIHTYILDNIKTTINEHKIRRICDYGCGQGDLLKKLNNFDANLELTGVDYFSKFRRDKPTTDIDSSVKYIDKDSEEFSSIQDECKFDMLISTFAMHHFKYPIQELKTIVNMVKTEGILVFVDFSFINDTSARITKNISSFIEEMGAAIKGGYHRHHYTLAEAVDLLGALPVEVFDSFEAVNDLSKEEIKSNVEQKIKRNARIIKNISEKAPEDWKNLWLPFFEQEKYLLERNGVDYSNIFFIIAKVK
jgi:ubiquinone/menaquinone biosynthesis C-methylase UbiE